MTKQEHIIRELIQGESAILREFLYHAIYVPAGISIPDKSIIDSPDIQVYIENFGSRPDDVCLVCEIGDKIIGAVWSRIMNDYGHVDENTPSLAISLLPEYRGHGIGTELMKTFLSKLENMGYSQVSLSVQKENIPAVSLYNKLGFSVTSETDEEYLMVLKFH